MGKYVANSDNDKFVAGRINRNVKCEMKFVMPISLKEKAKKLSWERSIKVGYPISFTGWLIGLIEAEIERDDNEKMEAVEEAERSKQLELDEDFLKSL
jgi:flavodoxin